MKLSRGALLLYRRGGPFTRPSDTRAAVSLHAHSEHSREKLDFIPAIARRIPVVSALFERSIGRYQAQHGRPLDFSRAYWRPPLAASQVIASEAAQIERRFNCKALVSLTDHDTLEGPRALRAAGRADVPLSLEWSAPFGDAVFHLGVHGVAPAIANDAERALHAYTERGEGTLPELMAWLCECPETFIVVNHPFWDLRGVGQMQHDSTLLAFLRTHRTHVHALELNGYRSWTENRRVLPLAEGFDLPVVGGGDRHGYLPNTIVNLTEASCLGEFARDLRAGGSTCSVVFPEYEEPLSARVMQTAAGVLHSIPGHHDGRCHWSDRVFTTVDGVERSLASMWSGASWWLHASVVMTRWLGTNSLRPLHELMRADGHESLESDCHPEPAFDSAALVNAPSSATVL